MSIRVLIWCGLVLAALTAATPAFASPEGVKDRVEDELLKDGLSLDRLELSLEVQALPNDAYLVELTDTKSGKSVAMRKVRELGQDQDAVVAKLTVVVSEMVKERDGAPAKEEAPKQQLETAQDAPQGILVNIKADDPEVVLYRHLSTSVGTAYGSGGSATVTAISFEQVCKSPCDRRVAVTDGHDFFLAGRGVSPTDLFSLESYQKDVTLKVEAGSAGLRAGGYWIAGLGLTSAILGGTFYALAKPADPTGEEIIGIERQPWQMGLLLGGIGGLVGGVAMMVAGGTDYEISGE